MTPWSRVADDARRYSRPLVGGIEPVRALVLADVEQRAALPPDARPMVGSDWARLYHALLDASLAAVQAGASVTTRRELMASVFEARWMMGQSAAPVETPPAREWIDDTDAGAAMAEALEGTCTAAGCPIQGWHEEHVVGGAEAAKERMRRWAEADGLSPETSAEASRQVDERVAMGTWGVVADQ